MSHEFRAIVGPDHVARVVYVPEASPVAGCIARSAWATRCEEAAAAFNQAREEREEALRRGQGELFA